MASLWPPSIPTATLHKKPPAGPSPDSDVARTALLASDPKDPWWSVLFGGIIRRSGSEPTAGNPATPTKLTGGEEGKGIGMKKRSMLTAEKARVLRKEMRVTEIWHDGMYHSAIASRMASPDDP